MNNIDNEYEKIKLEAKKISLITFTIIGIVIIILVIIIFFVKFFSTREDYYMLEVTSNNKKQLVDLFESEEINYCESFYKIEYIYLDNIKKVKDALNFINRIMNFEVDNSNESKTIRQIILEKNSKVMKLSDRAYAYKD